MRKLFSFVFALLLFATPVLAEDYSLDEMTMDELVELRRLINVEISERLAETSAVFYPFDYVVGRDIPAGRYIITGESATRSYGYIYHIPAGAADFSSIEYLEVGAEYSIQLEEGDTLRIEDCTVTIRRFIVPSI